MNKKAEELSPSTKIQHRIMQLKAQKEEQEEILKHDLREVMAKVSPVNIIKSTVHDLKADPEFRQDAIRQGISIGTGLLLDAIVFRKGFGLKSSLISVGLKKVISHFVHRK